MATFGGPADWWTDGTDAGRTHIATKGIVQDGLVLNLDAGVDSSYPNSGTTWADLSGNGNNGTLVNGPTFDSGNGGAIVFDGVNDYVNCGNFNFNSSLNYSINVWVKSSTSTIQYILTCDSSGCGNPPMFATTIGNDARFRYSSVQNTTLVSNRNNLNDSEWHNICYIKNTTSLSIYIDGNLDSFLSTVSRSGTSTRSLWIGARVGSITNPGGCGTNFLNGAISALQFYNRALTPSEISQNYNTTKGRFGL